MDNKEIASSISTEIEDPNLAMKIEQLIQHNENVTLPAIVLEYVTKENIDFDYNDFKNFFSQFGKIEAFELKGKICIILFQTFLNANSCREILSKEENLKADMQKNIIVRWYKPEKDEQLLSAEQKEKFDSFNNQKQQHQPNINQTTNGVNMPMNKTKKIILNPNSKMQMNQMHNQIIPNQFIPPNMGINMNVIPNMGMMNQNGMNMPNIPINNFYQNPNFMMNQMMMQNQNNPNNKIKMNNSPPFQNQLQNVNYYNNPQKSLNNNDQNNNMYYEEKSTYGKFTCKFEILIPNDQDFQVVRRLIGSKGCNMKKIVDSCKSGDQSNVKLRLRGRGSGYKEGPQNRESEDPLHLCISAKNQESLKKASSLVNDLITKIYDEYKKHCIKNGIAPLPKIANKIDGGNSFHNKNNQAMGSHY